MLVAWVEQLLADGDARDAWLAELARLVGGTAQLARDAVTLTLGDVAITLGLRVTPGAAGHPVLVPWAEVGYATRQGVSVGGGIDLMRIDTATGSVRAVPQVRVEAVFGADATAGASRLVATGPVEIGSVHVGVRLDDLARPAFALTLHDVDISAGGAPRHHELLDLSSPDAALDAVDDVIDDALGSALDALGQAGQLVKQLLGIEPPAGVNEISIVDIVTDPLNTIRAYYAELIGDADAMREVLATLQGLLTGVTGGVVTGTGSLVEPWRVVLAAAGGAGGLGLTVWVTDGHVVVAAAADLATPTFGGLTVAADLRMVLLDADLTRGQVALAPGGSARLLLQPGGAGPATVSVGVADLEFAGAGVEVGWRAGTGLTFGVVGDGLTVIVSDIVGSGPGGLAVADTPIRLALALPAVGPGGTITWAPDWDDVEVLLGRLLGEARVPIVDTLLDLVGWVPSTGIQRSGAGQARLSLSALIADPAAAITAWAVDLALDCDHLHAALGVLTSVLSGMSMRAPVGLGRVDLPYRSPIAGVLAAPAVVAWTEPPCPPSPATLIGGPLGLLDGIHVGAQGDIDDALPVGADLLAALAQATPAVPGLDDLLFARSGLGGGFDQLVARWTGTDGVTGPTSSLPTGVTSTVLTGYGYAELAAFGRSATDLLAGLTTATTAVAHVGCGSDWGAGYPAGEIVDATGGTTGAAAPAGGLDAAADGRWFVRLADRGGCRRSTQRPRCRGRPGGPSRRAARGPHGADRAGRVRRRGRGRDPGRGGGCAGVRGGHRRHAVVAGICHLHADRARWRRGRILVGPASGRHGRSRMAGRTAGRAGIAARAWRRPGATRDLRDRPWGSAVGGVRGPPPRARGARRVRGAERHRCHGGPGVGRDAGDRRSFRGSRRRNRPRIVESPRASARRHRPAGTRRRHRRADDRRGREARPRPGRARSATGDRTGARRGT